MVKRPKNATRNSSTFISKRKTISLLGLAALLLPFASCSDDTSTSATQDEIVSGTTTETTDSSPSTEEPLGDEVPSTIKPDTTDETPGTDPAGPEKKQTKNPDSKQDKQPQPGETSKTLLADKPECYTSIFRDDFNTLTSKWDVYNSDGNAGFGKRSPGAVSVKDGRLTIRASMKNGELTSGGMSAPVAQRYGFWTARVRIDADPSKATSGVFILWPETNSSADGETNIWETIGERVEGEPDRKPVRSFVHYGHGNNQRHFEHSGSDGTQWATVAAEWTPEKLTLYYNGKETGTVTNPAELPKTKLRATLQNDAWKNQMGAPVNMQVDWIEIYDYIC